MKKPLPLLKNLLTNDMRFYCTVLLFLVMSFAADKSGAQVYWSTNDANVASTADDAYYRMNYDGTNKTTVSSNLVNLTIGFAIDGNNNRMFAYEAKPGALGIKVLNLTTGVLIRTISLPSEVFELRDMEYDPRTDYLYYVSEGGDGTGTNGGTVANSGDALYRVHGDGTGQETMASSFCKNAYRMELDKVNNRLIVFQANFSERRLFFIDIATKAVTFRSFGTSVNTLWDIAYDETNDYIYYLCENGNGGAVNASDQLRRQKSDGTGDVVLISSFLNSPYRIALDEGNNRAYVSDSYYAAAKIVSVNLSNNTYSTVFTANQALNGPVIQQIAVPDPPSVTTTIASSVSSSFATLGGNLLYGYGLSTERGVVYSSTNQTPTVSDSKAVMATNTSNGTYSANVTGLNPTTTYYARSYAINGAGTTYGAVSSFTTQSNDATLSSLAISSGTLSPGFASGTINYSASVLSSVSTVTVTPTVNNATATVKVNGASVTSGSASGNISLATGSNTVTAVVTAQDGTTKTYTLTVTRAKAAQTITFAALPAKTYGDVDFAAGASASSGLGISYSSDNTNVATIVNGNIHVVGAGTANITASQAGDANNGAAANATQTLTVTARAITVTATANQTKIYGNADPEYTYAVTSGSLISGDSFTGALSRAAGSNAGSYAISIGTLALNTTNYTLSFTGDNFTISKRPLEITPTVQTKVFGNNDPASYTYTFTSGTSIASGDGMTGLFTRAAGEAPGTYALSIGAKHPVNINNGADLSANYNINFVSVNLTITKRPITLKPVDRSKTYGDTDPYLNAFSITSGTLAPTNATTGAFERLAGESIGTYTVNGLGTKKILSSDGINDYTAYYDITIVPATFTINAKDIMVTATAQTKTYGDNDAALTYATSTALAFSDAFTGELTRVAGENAGTYAISKGTLALNSNYNLSFTGADFTIDAKTINVTADAQSVPYGDPIPALTYTNNALVTGDSFTGELSRTAGNSVGVYPITQGSLALNSNYILNFTGADLQITKRVINVTAAAKSKTYGDADPELTYTADALIGGDGFSGALTRDAGESFGTYAINKGSLNLNGNYQINYTGANLTIAKRDINVFAFSQTSEYGDADKTISYYSTGTLASGDAITGAPGREPGTAIGDYSITQGSITVSNAGSYNLTFNSATYSIIKRDIQVTAVFKTKIYGEADPAITYSIFSGSLLAGAEITGSLVRDAGENSGPYAIRQGTLAIADPNYTLTYLGGSLEIDRAPLNIKVDDKTKLVNTPNPSFTYTITGFKNGDNESAFNSPVMFFNVPLASEPIGTYDFFLAPVNAINYDITVQSGILTVRARSTNADLAALTVNYGAFTPTFDTGTADYEMSVPEGVTTIDITPTVADTNATVMVNYFGATSGQPSTQYLYPGDNFIPVTVTAEDVNVYKQYSINIKTPLNKDAKLAGIYFYGDGPSPSLDVDPDVHEYTLDVPNSTQYLRIVPITRSSLGTFVKINGSPYEGYFAPGLMPGANVYSIEVFAQDRTVSETYTLTINRALSSNNNLYGIQLSAATLSPSFDQAITNYTASVASNVNSLVIETGVADTTARFKINNVAFNTYAQHTVTLVGGENTFDIKVTAKNGDLKDYVVVITKALSSDNLLSNLIVSGVEINPIFNSSVVSYAATINSGVSNISLTATAHDAGATIKVNGAPAVSGNLSTVAVYPGENAISVIVTPEDNSAVKEYTLNITRIYSDATLSALTVSEGTLSPAFTASGTNYTVLVDATVQTIVLNATTNNSYGIVKINGVEVEPNAPQTLTGGDNVFTIEVLAQDRTVTKTYTVTVQRPASYKPNITFALNPSYQLKQVAADGADVNFTTRVSNSVSSIKITPTASYLGTTISVNGIAVVSGTASQDIMLSLGNNVIDVIGTAENGYTTRHYRITVTRVAGIDAGLALALSPYYKLTQVAANGADVNFTTKVSSTVSSITVTPTPSQAGATIKVNGIAVAAGTPSQAITLVPGNNIIDVVGTAEDGVNTRSYRISVSKAASNIAGVSLALSPYYKLTQVTAAGADVNFTAKVSNSVSSITVTPTPTQGGATITVNGWAVPAGIPSQAIALNIGTNVIDVVGTAEDGIATRSYRITITRVGLTDAGLSLALSPYYKLTQVSESGADVNFTALVPNTLASLAVTATSKASGTITVNGVSVASGVASNAITLIDGTNIIDVIGSAQNGVNTRSYRIKVFKQSSFVPIASTKDGAKVLFADKANSFAPSDNDGVVVRQGVSPNGDGSNDFLVIEGITAYSGNKVSIMDANGSLVYDTKNYGDNGNVFDGHSKNGAKLKPGTYFYALEYAVGSQGKRKTGFIVLKY